jgi:ribonuclease BN (tRNA processing enzyme)
MKRLLTLCLLLLSLLSAFSQEQLPPWQRGYFDIHHISTGRGDCAYLVFPDGTTLLVDAGDMSDTRARVLSPRNTARKPNPSRTAPEWIADYIRQFAPQGRPPVLDYALITHYHDDHMGEWDKTRQRSASGGYALTGIMGVGEQIPIHCLLDRGHEFPISLKE